MEHALPGHQSGASLAAGDTQLATPSGIDLVVPMTGEHVMTESKEDPSAPPEGGQDPKQGGASERAPGDSSPNTGFSSADPPRAPSGLSTGLQPGGLVPGGGPGASVGSIGTGGAQTDNKDTGSLKRDGR